MDFLEELYMAYRLKDVDRMGLVGKRHESAAEHTYSSIVLAEYFLKKHPELDEIRVIRMILYHDFGEIHTGDTFILDHEKRAKKIEMEDGAMKTLEKQLPKEIAGDMKKAWKEYKENSTREAKFARAIDALDPIVHVIEQPEEWRKHGFTEKKLREYKEPPLKEFPELMKFFNEMVKLLKEKKVIPEEVK